MKDTATAWAWEHIAAARAPQTKTTLLAIARLTDLAVDAAAEQAESPAGLRFDGGAFADVPRTREVPPIPLEDVSALTGIPLAESYACVHELAVCNLLTVGRTRECQLPSQALNPSAGGLR